MKSSDVEKLLIKYEHQLDSPEPLYLAAIRHALSKTKHRIPSPPSKPYFDPKYRREKLKESFVTSADDVCSVNGWIASIHLFWQTAEQKRGRHTLYAVGASLCIDGLVVLEVSAAGSAADRAHWQIRAGQIVLGQLWRCLRSHGAPDPRRYAVSAVVSQETLDWLAPHLRARRMKLPPAIRQDWHTVTTEVDRWRLLGWTLSDCLDPLDRRAEQLAQFALRRS